MTATGEYRQLSEAQITGRLRRLRDRISERFPESGLSRLSSELILVSQEAKASVDYVAGAHQLRSIVHIVDMHQLTKDPERLAALFVQHFNDPVVLSTVNEVETLVTGLSGKIWQKITLLERVSPVHADRA